MLQGRASGVAVALCCACLWLVLQTGSAQDAGMNGTELSCGVVVWGTQDYEWQITSVNGSVVNYTSNCIEGVRRARQRCGGKKLNFVITQFWKYPNTSDGSYRPGSLCYKVNVGDDQAPIYCPDLSNSTANETARAEGLIYRFYKGMKGCFITAIWEGFTVLKITPRLDDGSGQANWRNLLELNPYEQFQGYSYVDAVLRPLTQAVNESIVQTNATDTVQVYFGLQGEMNAALAAYPQQWRSVMQDVKSNISGSDQNSFSNLKVGVGMNFNKLCGVPCQSSDQVSNSVDTSAYQDLINSVDYLAISNYGRLGNASNPNTWNLESAAMDYSDELKVLTGSTLQDYISQGKEFQLAEYGIGGGRNVNGTQPATNLQELANYPYFGIFGSYGMYPDPWRNPQFSDFRRMFYNQTIRWLAGENNMMYPVDGVFIWSMSSWDVAGIYWASTTANGTYYDPQVMNMIKAWNDNGTVPS